MKKSIFLLLTGLTFGIAQSQNITDALRYSQDNTNGTARYRAMSGAFGALGGDMSSLNVNPAGSAVFANNQMAFTINNNSIKNDSDYFGTKKKNTLNSFDFNQAGGVFVFKNQETSSDWKKFSVAINYENATNFDNELIAFGTNPTHSIDQYFLSYANTGNDGLPVPQEFVNRENGESIPNLYSYLASNLPNNQYPKLNGFAAQQAMIAFYNQGNIIDANEINNPFSTYISNVPAGGMYYQENTVVSKGNNGKLNFNFATSYKDRLYLGLNLNSHFTDYRQNSTFYEDNSNPLENKYTVSNLQFDNTLYTHGTGFSFQLGAIAKITDEFRAGLAYESPTWYHLTDEFSQNLVVTSSKIGAANSVDSVNPDTTIVYDPYTLQTPGKWNFSLAYVFGKKGLISLDYGVKDYGSANYQPAKEVFFSNLNANIGETLSSTNELKLGAEYKIEAWSLRAGYRFEESPYKNKTTVGNLNGYSLGLGYNFGSTKLDFAYAQSKRMLQQGFFNKGFTDGAKINNVNNIVTVTLAFEL
jgi:long-subunit fatty acid transport protein